MNPSYKLQLDLYIRMPVESQSVWMRRIGYLPFVPRQGDTLRISSDKDEEQQADLTIDETVWDMAGGMFIGTITDDSIVEAYSEGGLSGPLLNKTLDEYQQLGFMRLNFPQAKVIHAS